MASLYDVVIVGRGMIGSAAARHMSLLLQTRNERKNIALVGPEEGGSTSVYGAHYDEGRITRKTDPDPVWAELASRSIDRYQDICPDLSFYEECGHLAVSTADSEVIRNRLNNVERMQLQESVAHLAKNNDLRSRFPYLQFPDNYQGIFEAKQAGYISARGLVQAQCERAKEMGVEIHNLVVETITRNSNSNIFEIMTSNGQTLKARNVLVATGAFTNFKPLLPFPLDLTPIQTQTVQFVLNKNDAERLKSMPSVIFKDSEYWSYILPPIQYPDGTVRLKLGGGSVNESRDRSMSTYEQVLNWYKTKQGNNDDHQEMIQLLHRFVPNVTPIQILSDTCATLNTPNRQAYIGQVAPGWFVATGGNGFAAKSSDELGRLAAVCVIDPTAFREESIGGALVADLLKPILLSSDSFSNLPNKRY